MENIFISIAVGILLGCTDIFSFNTKKWLSRFSTAALFVMLWCLGAKIGCDDELLHNFGLLGYKATTISAGVIIGSLASVWFVTKLFADTIRQEEKEGKK